MSSIAAAMDTQPEEPPLFQQLDYLLHEDGSLDDAIRSIRGSDFSLFQLLEYTLKSDEHVLSSDSASTPEPEVPLLEPQTLQRALDQAPIEKTREKFCIACGKLKNHFIKYSQGKYSHPLRCSVCYSELARIRDLKRHYELLHNIVVIHNNRRKIETLICAICREKISCFDMIKDHFVQHHGTEITNYEPMSYQ